MGVYIPPFDFNYYKFAQYKQKEVRHIYMKY